MNATRLRRLCQCAMFAAVIYVFTAYLHVPSFNGYTHIGDGFLYLAASLLPTGYAAAAGAVGAGLADLLSGYSIWAPATLVIKAVMGVLAAVCYQAFGRGRGPLGLVACGIVGELPMVVGYWLYDGVLMASLTGAAAGIPSNLAQAAFGIAASTLLAAALSRSAYVRREFPRL